MQYTNYKENGEIIEFCMSLTPLRNLLIRVQRFFAF